MSPPSDKERISTLLFRIPHISNLLIFKDVLQEKEPLIAILIGVLKLKNPEILYMGHDCLYSPAKDDMAQKPDAALIRLCFPGKEIIRRDKEKTVGLAISELQKDSNLISVASDVLSKERNIIAVAISVESFRRNRYGLSFPGGLHQNS